MSNCSPTVVCKNVKIGPTGPKGLPGNPGPNGTNLTPPQWAQFDAKVSVDPLVPAQTPLRVPIPDGTNVLVPISDMIATAVGTGSINQSTYSSSGLSVDATGTLTVNESGTYRIGVYCNLFWKRVPGDTGDDTFTGSRQVVEWTLVFDKTGASPDPTTGHFLQELYVQPVNTTAKGEAFFVANLDADDYNLILSPVGNNGGVPATPAIVTSMGYSVTKLITS